MTYLTPHQILSKIKWQEKPTTQLYMMVADYLSKNIIEVNEIILESLSQGKTEISIDPNNSITIN